jgi:hypothetical protein
MKQKHLNVNSGITALKDGADVKRMGQGVLSSESIPEHSGH